MNADPDPDPDIRAPHLIISFRRLREGEVGGAPPPGYDGVWTWVLRMAASVRLG